MLWDWSESHFLLMDSLPAVVCRWCWRWPFQGAEQLRSRLWCHTWRNEAAAEWFQTRGTGCLSGQTQSKVQRRWWWQTKEVLITWEENVLYDCTHTCLLTHILPSFPSNKGFDVQIYWYIFWGDNGDSDTARQVLDAGVDNMALPLKYPFCEDEHCTDNGLWSG